MTNTASARAAQLILTPRDSSPDIVGLEISVQFPNNPKFCPVCHGNSLRIGSSAGPDCNELHCHDCGEPAGFMSKKTADFVTAVVARWGRPNQLIVVRRRDLQGQGVGVTLLPSS